MPDPSTALVIGADIGGTSTRVAVADLSGRVLNLARGGPGNPNSVGLAGSADQIRAVTAEALEGLSGEVVAATLGLAGGSRITDQAPFLRSAVPETVRCLPRLVSDFAVSFCSGTPARTGYAVIAGTGAGSGRISDDEMVERRDAWGWLLGDEGSGFWLGRAAVRATLLAFERDRPLGPLGHRVLDFAGCRTPVDLIATCYAHPPTWLASFATLVSETAALDPVAREITEECAAILTGSVLSLDPRPGLPIVLGGSVLTEPGPISNAFERHLSAQLPNPVLRSSLGVLGALWIALRGLVADDPAVHAQLLATGAAWR
ncbi:BadF/BadG/BcrA/BcrD ATPase family protein [Microlunatus panaciterrae]|uniref:N-acetylglucosamine kinase-like BadF-type ATPase n=1 Tax=Microlunatus panaciterrae TaxID=400768 RepID=A0ABS2REN2_9ACTN|nr:BadF/BadG/BcrA/BcrD ATPase family protein [Microlunatus panaciterrae]MBM7797417.1 N-acetylglucosamine kinase-like BadF-type ATPase [Microlunatus panaciterrae]